MRTKITENKQIITNKITSRSHSNQVSKVINQGGFGCIFRPSLPCKNIDKNKLDSVDDSGSNANYVSKLVQKNFNAENEIRIGQIIKQIPFFYLYYIPVIHSCTASLAKINHREITKCHIIKNENEKTDNKKNEFLLLNMTYVDNIKFTKYLLSGINKKRILNIIFDTYSYFLFSLEQLMNNGIVHYDFKWDNAVIDLKTELPVILDFGISIPIAAIVESGSNNSGGGGDNEDNEDNEDKYEKYRKYFYIYYPSYSLWSLEIHLINYVLHQHSRITLESLKITIDEYADSNSAFTILSPEFMERYKQLCFATLERFIDKSREYVIQECLQFWKTWDNYSLSISYLQIIKFISTSGFTSNAFLISFSKILMDNIHPDPTRRSDFSTTKYKYKSIFYQESSIENYELLIDNFDFQDFKSHSLKESRRNEDMFSRMSLSQSQ